MRKISALTIAIGMMAAMTACAGTPSYSGCSTYNSGDASNVIEANGKFGSDPKVDFPTPMVTDTTQATQLIRGDGEVLRDGQAVSVELSIFNGTTGEKIQSSAFDGKGVLTVVGESLRPAVGPAIECATVGSRIAIAASAEEAHNATAIPDLKVEADDDYVFVVDVLDAYLGKADGAPQLPQRGDPVVVTAPNGAPGITIPNSGSDTAEPPTDLKVSLLKKGDGAEVKDGAKAVLQYTGVLWNNNEVFDSSWKNGAPAAFELADGKIIEGFKDAIVGQTVGSQVLAVIPPDLAYGDQQAGPIPGGSTLVFVVDILGLIK